MSESLYFYKLVSPYVDEHGKPCDVTKNCKLSVSEIDSNFLTLKDYDIKEVKVGEDKKSIILVRNNGEELSTSLNVVNDIEVDWDKPNGKLTITCDDEVHVIDGLLTDEDDLLKGVSHGSTLYGRGTPKHPLDVSLVERTGTYSPVDKIINMTEGEVLPEEPSFNDRFITYEWISDYGYLYNFDAVKSINKSLSDNSSQWRVPSKADWDKLLNSIEPCGYKNHDDEGCHEMLGKYAGVKLKSVDGWKPWVINSHHNNEGLEVVPLQPAGIDEFGFKVLPSGEGDEEGIAEFFTEKTGFWSTSHIKTPEHQEESGDPKQDVYVKIFDYRKTGVIQDAECVGRYYSLRLVKDYNGHNFRDVEVINGITYRTILFEDAGQIWISTNVAYPTEDGKLIPNNGENIDKRKAYFLTVYNGKEWEKKQLMVGDSVVVMNGPEAENVEYRVFLDDNGDQIIVSVEGAVYERVIEIVMPLIEEEARIREQVDNEQWAAISAETATREEVDNQQWAAISAETATREQVDNEQWEAINAEAATREEVDNQQWEAISAEAATREQVDNELWSAISAETATREQVDNEQWEAISAETATREEVDNQQWAAISAETVTREEVDNQQWEAINAEAATREEVDNQQWAQIIDNPNDPSGKKNVNTPDEYVIKVNNGEGTNITLFSKGGTNDIEIFFDGNFGEI